MGTNNTNLSEPSSSDYFEAVATKVTMVSIIGNFIRLLSFWQVSSHIPARWSAMQFTRHPMCSAALS